MAKQNHTVTEWWRLEGTCGGHLVPPLYSSRATCGRSPRTMSMWLWRITKEGDSRTSLYKINLLPFVIVLLNQTFFVFIWSLFSFHPNYNYFGTL